jgi:hypothetical protein
MFFTYNHINWLVFVMKTKGVYCEVGNNLCVIYWTSDLKVIKKAYLIYITLAFLGVSNRNTFCVPLRLVTKPVAAYVKAVNIRPLKARLSAVIKTTLTKFSSRYSCLAFNLLFCHLSRFFQCSVCDWHVLNLVRFIQTLLEGKITNKFAVSVGVFSFIMWCQNDM